MKNNILEFDNFEPEIMNVILACNNYNQLHISLNKVLNSLPDGEKRMVIDVFEGDPVVNLIKNKKKKGS